MNYKTLKVAIFINLIIGFTLNYGVEAKDKSFYFGAEVGLASADIGADDTAQTLANLSGSTVTYSYDEFTWAGRVFSGHPISQNIALELGFFKTGDLDAKYTISGASATEAYSMFGLDGSIVFKPKDSPLFFRAGVHQSKVDGSASITIGGTTYAAEASQSGSGWLLGGGYKFGRDNFVFLSYYANVGGIDSADVTLCTLGTKF